MCIHLLIQYHFILMTSMFKSSWSRIVVEESGNIEAWQREHITWPCRLCQREAAIQKSAAHGAGCCASLCLLQHSAGQQVLYPPIYILDELNYLFLMCLFHTVITTTSISHHPRPIYLKCRKSFTSPFFNNLIIVTISSRNEQALPIIFIYPLQLTNITRSGNW